MPEREEGLLREGDDIPKFRPRRSAALEPAWTCDPAMTLYIGLDWVIEIVYKYVLGTGQRQLKAPWYRLNNDITVLDTLFLQFGNRARDQRVYDSLVPSCVHDGDTQ